MKIFCAWCEKFEGEKGPSNIHSTTYTICENCYVLFRRHAEENNAEDKFKFLQKKIEHINKWIEKALYEKATPEKNDALFHVLKQIVCLNTYLENAFPKIKSNKQ